MDELPTKNRAEPHRRLLRHTYQEGPGFLFLATRGGRPPAPPTDSPGSASGFAAYASHGRTASVPRSHSGRPGEPPSLAADAAGGLGALAAGPADRTRPPAGMGGAGGHRRATAHVLEQQAPGGRVHPAGDLPARPPCGRWPAGRARHRPAVDPAGRGPAYERGRPTSLAHRHQGSVLPAPRGASTPRSGSSASSTTTPGSSSGCASCPGRRPRRSSPGSMTASSCAACRSS